VAFIMFLILRRLLGSRLAASKTRFYTEERERVQLREKQKVGGLLRPKDPRLAVRWYYRKFLKEGVTRGGRQGVADTSLSILRRFEHLFPDGGSAELRDVYIMARYNYRKEPTKADVEATAKIWREMS